MAATEHNIGLVVGKILTSHTGIAYHVEHNAQGMPPHHSFSLLISVKMCVCRVLSLSVLYWVTCFSHYLWTIQHQDLTRVILPNLIAIYFVWKSILRQHASSVQQNL